MFKTTCPKCGEANCLSVISCVWLGSTPLSPDGFSFLDARMSSTEDERVKCEACGAEMDLGELTVEDS